MRMVLNSGEIDPDESPDSSPTCEVCGRVLVRRGERVPDHRTHALAGTMRGRECRRCYQRAYKLGRRIRTAPGTPGWLVVEEFEYFRRPDLSQTKNFVLVAAELGMSPRAVEAAILRHKRRLRAQEPVSRLSA